MSSPARASARALPHEPFPEGWIKEERRARELAAAAETLAEDYRRLGFVDLEVEMRRRVAELKGPRRRRQKAAWLNRHRREARAPVRQLLPSRPRARARRTRAAARRAAGARSGQDPGEPPGEQAPLADVIPLRRRPAIYSFGRISAEQRGAEVEAVVA